MNGTDGKLAGRVAVVTGGASGIGREIALSLAAAGAAVAIADLARDRCEAVGRAIEAQGAHALPWCTDVTDLEQIRTLFRETERAFGSLDILVNCAGIVLPGSIAETTPEDWDAVLRVDLTGAFLCLQHAVPLMRRAGGGSVVNVTSVAAARGIANRPAYTAAKGGLTALTRQAANELAPLGIRVNAVAPGVVDTAITVRDEQTTAAMLANVPAGRAATPAEVASVVAFLASDDAAYLTGATLPVDGGLASSLRIHAPAFGSNA